MTKLQDGALVIVLTEDGRRSDLGTFHGWDRRGAEWWAHVMVYGPRRPDSGTGQYRDTVPAARVLPLVCCDWNPVTREAHHTCEGHALMTDDLKVWA